MRDIKDLIENLKGKTPKEKAFYAKKEVLKTGITIVQVPRGVNFGNDADSKIATMLFGIAGVGNEHLDLIQKISIFCADVDNVVKLADAQTAEEIADLLNSVEV